MKLYTLISLGLTVAQIQNDINRRELITDPTRHDLPTPTPSSDEPEPTSSSDHESNSQSKSGSKSEDSKSKKSSSSTTSRYSGVKSRLAAETSDSPIVNLNAGLADTPSVWMALSVSLVASQFMAL